MSEVLQIFSCKSAEDIRALGGVGWFKLSQSRAEACGHVVVYHNANDPRKPGRSDLHRMPVFIGEIDGTITDPADGRVALQLRRLAPAFGPHQDVSGRSPVTYVNGGLIDELSVGLWENVKPLSVCAAIAERARWDRENTPQN